MEEATSTSEPPWITPHGGTTEERAGARGRGGDQYARSMVRRPDPEPLETDDVRIVAGGTALWALAFVVLLILKAAGTDVHGWWLWMCASGVGLGLIGIRTCLNRRKRFSSPG